MTPTERAFELFKAIAADDDLRERLSAASEADRQSIIANMGFADVTAEAIEAATNLLAPDSLGELSDQELEQIAGGYDPLLIKQLTATTTTVTASASASVAT